VLPLPPQHPLEQDARIVFHRQRRRGASPGNRVRVRAAEADVARASEIPPLDRGLERGELCLLAEMPRDQLVDGDAGLDFRRVGTLRRNVREEPRRRARMHPGPGCEGRGC
jgi:hypothetical protein